MSKLNKKSSAPFARTGTGPLKVTKTEVKNFEGFDASMYGKKSQLLLMAVNTFSGEDTYYNKAATRDAEMRNLVQLVALRDPEWMTRFLPWLRNTANIRTSAITMAIDTTAVWLKAGIPGGRGLINSVLARADEPGEALAYAMSVFGARRIPKPVKRGIADAATRLYNEFTLLKYDSDSSAVRFGDVLELTHPNAGSASPLFKYAIDVRHGRGNPDNFASLPMIASNKMVRDSWNRDRVNIPSSVQLKQAGMDWQNVLSALGSKVDKKTLWEALIPTMPYMSTLRNLRNFEQAGIGAKSIQFVQDKLSDPGEVARSKQFPMRFLSAYRNVVSDTYKYAIEQALQMSLSNIPAVHGRTLILVDTSGSMNSPMSDKSGLMRWDAAVIFGLALAQRCDDVQLVSFSDGQIGYSGYSRRQCTGKASAEFPMIKGESLLRGIDRWDKEGFFLGAGTDTAGAVNRHFREHRRVIILTDEQAQTGNPYRRLPDSVIKIDINLAGYGHSHAGKETKNLIKLAGLTDSMFSLIPALEAGLDESWPF